VGKREGGGVDTLKDVGVRGWMVQKLNLNYERDGVERVCLSVSRQRHYANTSEHSNESSLYVKFWEPDIQRTVHRDIFL